MHRFTFRHFLFLGAAWTLTGCAGELPSLKMSDIPALWEQKPDPLAPAWPDKEWWRGFASDELNNLIAQAQADNLDIAAAEARVLQADAQARVAGSGLLPSLKLSGGGDRRLSSASTRGTAGSANSFSANVGASYEVDFWGANSEAFAAARYSKHASEADRATVALSVTSGTANAYFQLLSARDRLAIAKQNLETAEAVYAITASRVRNGVASQLEEAQQLATLAGQRANVPRLEQAELEARAALALLLGKLPEGFDVAGKDLNAVASPSVAPGLTSELLTRRPDIVAQEQTLRAADANVAVARAAFFPAISLTANGGVQSTALSSLFDGNVASSIGLNLVQTIFDGGRLIAQRDSAKAREQEALASYRNTVITAFSDVETALGNVVHLKSQDDEAAEQLRQLQRAFDIANARYREGVSDYLTVLDAQRSLYSARDSYQQIKLQRLQAILTLYRALGGGWRDSDIAPAAVATN